MNVAPLKKTGPSRMTLASVRKGPIERAERIAIYGVEGVGKSTFAAGAPAPIFLGADSGTGNLDVTRLPEPETWADVLDAVRMLRHEAHEFRTLVIDPANFIEPLCWAHVCGLAKVTDIEAVGGGYGKGYTAATDQWRQLLAELERLWIDKGMHIVIAAHATVRNFPNPEGESYDRYEMALHKGAAGLIRGWVDHVLFARHESFTRREGKKAKGVSTGARVVHATWSAAYDAKNRASLPDEPIPLGWTQFFEALNAASAASSAEAIVARIRELAAQVGGDAPARAEKYIATANGRTDYLKQVENKLLMKLEEKGT